MSAITVEYKGRAQSGCNTKSRGGTNYSSSLPNETVGWALLDEAIGRREEVVVTSLSAASAASIHSE